MSIREKTIEKYLTDRIKAIGGITIKQQGVRGVPDQLILYRGDAVFVEVKQPNGVVGDHQMRYMEKISNAGVMVVVVWGKEDVDALIADMIRFYKEIDTMIASTEGEECLH